MKNHPGKQCIAISRRKKTLVGDDPNPREHLQMADELREGFRCFGRNKIIEIKD